MAIVLLYTLAPLIILIYKILEYFGFWDHLSGRRYAITGLKRLKATNGYPKSWIYDKGVDKTEFKALYRRIRKRTSEDKIKRVLKDGYKPSLLTTGGSPIMLNGLPNHWEQENRSYYSSNHPIMMIFEDEKKGERCCSIGELEKWIENEKRQWDFWVGVIVLSIFSIASIIWRLQVLGKI